MTLQAMAPSDLIAVSPVAPRRPVTIEVSIYPARRGYEDLVMLVADDTLPFAWSAVTFPAQRYAWFAIRDPRVLRETVLWMSNGGRHYHPWSSRHVNVMGIEDVTSYFHHGYADSVRANPIARRGYPTCLKLNARRPLSVNYITAVASIPRGFDRVKSISAARDKHSVTLTSFSGKRVTTPLDLGFLKDG